MAETEILGFHYEWVPSDKSGQPILVLLHGTGGDEASLLDLGATIAPEANLLGIRGRSREEGQNRFFRRYAEGVFDEHDMMLQASCLKQFLTTFRAEYEVSSPMIAVGYSNGANMAAVMMLLDTDSFAGAVLLRPMLPLHTAKLPNLDGVKVLVRGAAADPYAPLESAEMLIESLTAAGAKVEADFTAAGHYLNRADVESATDWYNRLWQSGGLAAQEKIS